MLFNQSFNAIYSRCKSTNCELFCINLLKSYCLPLILYAREVLSPNNRNMVMLNKAIDSAVNKVFSIYDRGNISYICEALELCT